MRKILTVLIAAATIAAAAIATPTTADARWGRGWGWGGGAVLGGLAAGAILCRAGLRLAQRPDRVRVAARLLLSSGGLTALTATWCPIVAGTP